MAPNGVVRNLKIKEKETRKGHRSQRVPSQSGGNKEAGVGEDKAHNLVVKHLD